MKKPYLQDVGKIILASETYIQYKDQVLMHKRSMKKKTFPGYWIAPGGHIDEDEDALSAAIREVYEETGVMVDERAIQLKAIGFHRYIDTKELYVIYMFLASIQSYQPIVSNLEEGESFWVPQKDLVSLENVLPASVYYFPYIFTKESGILYTNLEIAGGEVQKVVKHRFDVG